MAGCVQKRKRDVTQPQLLAVRDFVMKEQQIRAGPGDGARAEGRQLARSRDEIGMHVRFDRGDDRQAAVPRGVDVFIHVPPGIHDGRIARAITRDEIRALCEPFLVEALKHGLRSSVQTRGS